MNLRLYFGLKIRAWNGVRTVNIKLIKHNICKIV